MRTHRRTLRRHSDGEEEQSTQIAKLQLEKLRSEFKSDVDEILKLPPLTAIPDPTDFLLTLGEVVYRGKRRRQNKHILAIETALSYANDAVVQIEKIIEGLAQIDIEQWETILFAANHLFPDDCPREMSVLGLFNMLNHSRKLLVMLNAVAPIATGISDSPRGRGQPRSPYIHLAWQLIDLWEATTAQRKSEDSPVWQISRVPTPKRLDTRDDQKDLLTKQHSTRFIRIALRMISPNITNAQVFTAIKEALATRDQFYQVVASGATRSFPELLEAFDVRLKERREREKQRHTRVRKKNP
jgi:hypothetical protein